MSDVDKKVMGIDPSLKSSGVIALDHRGEIVLQRVVKSEPCGLALHDRMRRIELITREILGFVEVLKPSVICIEAYSYGSDTIGVAERVELGGLLRYSICRIINKVYEVAPTTLKKFATGKGNVQGKLPVCLALNKRYGVVFDTDHEYDAFTLARIAYQIAGLEQSELKWQQECITTVTAPKVKKQKKARAR